MVSVWVWVVENERRRTFLIRVLSCRTGRTVGGKWALPFVAAAVYLKEKYLGPISASDFSRKLEVPTGISWNLGM